MDAGLRSGSALRSGKGTMMKRLMSFALTSMLLLTLALPAPAESQPDGYQRTECYIEASMGRLYGILQVPETEGPVPLVILSHGLGGTHRSHMDYAAYFASNGLATFSLDFCGGGFGSRSDGKIIQMSVLTEAEDLNAVIDHFKQDPRFSGICLLGDSQGGYVSSYVAAKRPGDIDALVLEYPAYVLEDDAKRRRQADGTFPEKSVLLGLTLGRGYSEALVSVDIYQTIGLYTGPVLILHGDADRLVPLSYSERAVGVYQNAELIVLPGQGHGFTGDSRQEAMEKGLSFLLGR